MNNRSIAKKVVTALVMLGVLAVLIISVDWQQAYTVIQQANPIFIAAALAVALARFIIWSVKWRRTISPLATISLSKVFPVLMTGVFLNQITPGRDTGGEPVRAYYLGRYTGLKKRQALATIVVDKSGNYIAIGSFIGFAILFITLYMDVASSIKVLFEAVLILFLLAVVSAVYVKKNLEMPFLSAKILRRIYFFGPLKTIRGKFQSYAVFEDYVMERVTEFITTLRELLSEKKNVRDNMLLSFLIWLMVFVKTWLIFLAFGDEVSFFMVIAVESISILLGIISFLPGGVGATEITMITLFRSAGINTEVATAVTIVSRGMYYAFSMGLGYLSFLYLKLRPENPAL
ncbi:hypothetical protein BMS3Abin16_01031 [archaeon BMS3Abin16]|nr:hypothetical protein BMS3Abin16_01031 [archaeon BMS3Abin16]GBE56854.1 hypothetical protein BMS3Bbin16_01067 [archaeon BMS3Bbin16]